MRCSSYPRRRRIVRPAAEDRTGTSTATCWRPSALHRPAKTGCHLRRRAPWWPVHRSWCSCPARYCSRRPASMRSSGNRNWSRPPSWPMCFPAPGRSARPDPAASLNQPRPRPGTERREPHRRRPGESPRRAERSAVGTDFCEGSALLEHPPRGPHGRRKAAAVAWASTAQPYRRTCLTDTRVIFLELMVARGIFGAGAVQSCYPTGPAGNPPAASPAVGGTSAVAVPAALAVPEGPVARIRRRLPRCASTGPSCRP